MSATVTGLPEDVRVALLTWDKPSRLFEGLRDSDALESRFPELARTIGVPQNPVYHPEGDVFVHTMLVLDAAAALRDRAREPLCFMLAALLHDLGKIVATEVSEEGKITAYGHEVKGLDLCEIQMRRLTDDDDAIRYVKNMMWLHMRPNMMAAAHSHRKKTRQLFDLSVCPEDLILLSRADATGKLDKPYDPSNEAFLRERLKDYRRVAARPGLTEDDLIAAGIEPGETLDRAVKRARSLLLSGQMRERVLLQVSREFAPGKRG